jgi:hypothetical protein
MTADCRQCGHPLGTHHAGTWEERLCAVKGCDCYGYAPLLKELRR